MQSETMLQQVTISDEAVEFRSEFREETCVPGTDSIAPFATSPPNTPPRSSTGMMRTRWGTVLS